MNNINKLKLNTITSLVNRFTIMISGLVLPRLILQYYGSEVNGLVQSISQFLSIITFLDFGVGSVVQSALYKPLTLNDDLQISKILIAAKNYFRRIAYILIIYVLFLIVFYPKLVNNQSLDIMNTSLLIFAISIGQFAQYYFGIINEFLLNADQKGYIQLGTEILVVILNLIVSIVFISKGAPIHTVKLFSSLVYLIRPIFLNIYVKNNYNLNLDLNLTEDPLPQRWSGMGQHIAYSIQSSTDITVLTLFSSLTNVSVYSVYNLVTNAITLIITSFTSGLQSFFGNLLANEEIETLNTYFSRFEWGIHALVTLLYSLTAVLITPFVTIYTGGVEDGNYYRPVFGLLLALSRAAFSLRTPYQSLVFSAGHFKQTQISSFIEAGLNIFASLLLFKPLGLVGVAIGSLISMIYRTIFLSVYLSKNIIYRPMHIFIKNILVDGIAFITIYGIGKWLLNYFEVLNFIDWIILGTIIGIVALLILLIINFIFYKNMIINLFGRLSRR